MRLARAACLAGFAVGASLSSSPVRAQNGPVLYVPNNGGPPGTSAVNTIDTSTNSVIDSFGSGAAGGVGVSGDESVAYVVYGNSLSVINTANNTVIATISGVTGDGPAGTNLVVSPDGKTAYISVANGLDVISTATNTVTSTIPLGSGAFPFGVAVSPDGSTVYVAEGGKNNVAVINTTTNAVATIAVGDRPTSVAVSPDGKTIYVTNANSSTVSVINTATNAVTATIPTPASGNSLSIIVSPDGKTVYVMGGSGTISVVNAATDTVTSTIATGGSRVAISPDGTTLYSAGNDYLASIDIATSTVTPITGNFFAVAYPGICSNGNALLASGLTFKANSSGALACTLASGPTGSPGPIFTGGTMQFDGANITSSLPIMLMAAGGTFDTAGNNATLSGAITGSGGLTKIGLGTLTLSGAGTYTGPTSVNAGTLQGGAVNAFSPYSAYTVASGATLDLNSFNQIIGSLSGAGSVTLGSATLTTGNDGTNTMFSGGISGPGGLTKIGAGTFILSGTNSYTGATTVNGGTLEVDGSINTVGVTVNAGGTLSGVGTVDPVMTTTIMSGGVLAPGNASNPTGALAITGNLAFQSGAIYLVQVGTAASSTNVSGSATLGGATVNAAFASGSHFSNQYTILTAAGGISGTFGSLVTSNVPTGFSPSLSYSNTNVFLNLTAGLGPPASGLNGNQQGIAATINNFFNSGGALPAGFLDLFGLTGANLSNALTQLSGETTTGAQQATFAAMTQFMGLLTDPFMNRSGGMNAPPGATGYAEQGASAYASNNTTDAFAMFTKAPYANVYDPHWSVWASGFGGSQTTQGNATTGSNTASSSIAGTAVGADYLLSPKTIAGFALAGGGTNFSVANGGSGRSDLFQAGAYIRHTEGGAYVSAALAYGWQDITTNRTVTVAGIDQLRAEFDANAYSGRIESGYRFVAPWTGGVGITPYAAGQFTTFDLPAYAETVVVGTPNFALSYAAESVTDARSELGVRLDKSFDVANGVLTLRGRLGWAHDYDPNRAVAATFQALPGASFVVNGAAMAPDSALTTASVEMKWRNGWSAGATFEGEFSDVTSSYAGKGVVRYTW
jgi:YVTN family beta-propeller protein/autotransporter-associated beta strand protein